MKLFWTPEAIEDRNVIFDYIVANNPVAAISLDEMFSEKASLLVEQNLLGRNRRVAGTRELVVHKNYILIYDITETAVRVLRVLHTAK